MVAALVTFGIDAYLTFLLTAKPPLVALMLKGVWVGGTALALLVVVMNSLLARAAAPGGAECGGLRGRCASEAAARRLAG